MKIKIAIAVCCGFIQAAFAQKDAAVKAYNYENYRTAANAFKTLVATESTGENYYYLGNAYGFLGKWDSARWAYDLGIKADAKYGPNYAGMAKAYLSQNNTTKAQEYFGMAKSTTNANKDVNYYNWLGEAWVNSANPNPQEAINILNKGKDINYKDGNTYFLLGEAYYKMSKGGDAVNNYDLALQYNPALIKSNVRIGNVWSDAHRYAEALAAYQKALAADPNYAPALRGLADLYYMTAQYDKAKETFGQYMKVGEMNDDMRYRQILLSFLNKDYATVQTQATDLLQRDSSKLVMRRLLAYSAYETGSYDQGYNQLSTFLRRSDTSKIISSDYEYLGKFQRRQGNDSLAALSYERAIRLDTSRKALYDTLATMFYGKKNYTQAAKYYNVKIANSKKPAIQDYFSLGRAYYFDSAFAKADSAFMRVTELSPTWPVGYVWRARAALSLDNPDKPQGLASPYYQKVIETAATDSVKYKREMIEALKYFGNLNTLNENYDEAMKYYNRVLAISPDEADVKKTVDAINESRKKKKP